MTSQQIIWREFKLLQIQQPEEQALQYVKQLIFRSLSTAVSVQYEYCSYPKFNIIYTHNGKDVTLPEYGKRQRKTNKKNVSQVPFILEYVNPSA